MLFLNPRAEERPRYALLYAALFYMAGLGCGYFSSFHYGFFVAAALLFILSAALLRRRNRTVYIAVFLLLFCLGLLRCTLELVRIPIPNPGPATIEARVECLFKVDAQKGRATYRMGEIDLMQGETAERLRSKAYVSLPLTARMPKVGERVRVAGSVYEAGTKRNPGGFDFYLYLRQHDMDFGVYGARVEQILASTGGMASLLKTARSALADRIETLYGERAGMLQGMLLGDKSSLPAETYEAFKRSGIAHLLAISGLHIGLIAAAVTWLFNSRGLSIRLRLALTAVVVGVFCLLIGLPASAVRAYVMCLLVIAAMAAGRSYNAPLAMAAASLLILTFDPLALFDMGFVLSFTTVLGISLLLARVQRCLTFLPEPLNGAISIAVAAQIASLPGQALFFGEVPLFGIPANLLCILLATLSVLLGLLSLIASFLFMPLGQAIAWFVSECLRAMDVLSRFFASLPFGSLRIPYIPVYAAIACIFCFFLLSPYAHLRRSLRLTASAALLLCVFGVFFALKDRDVRYIQLDVGQGDSAVLLSRGFTTVIDTGPQGDGALADLLRKEGRDVDLLLLSHLDADHAGALDELIDEGISVARIGVPTGIEEGETDPGILDALARLVQTGAVLEGYAQGDLIKTPQAQMDVLGPSPSAKGSNGRSLVVKIETQGVKILTTGDLPVQYEMHAGTHCDILKVSHHGAKNGTSAQLLKSASPTLALVSVGRNFYGHPAPEVLSRLAQAGVKTLRTDETGAIEIRLRDGQYRVRRFIQDKGALYDASGLF